MKKLRTAIIGCGKIFPMHAVSVTKTEHAQLVAVCDNKEERAKEAANMFSCNYYTDYKEMIEKEKLEAIHICTPHHLHAEMAIFAAKNNIHVLCEKPMALTFADAQKMQQVAEEQNVQMMISFQNRFNPGSLLIKKAIESNSLGKILAAKAIVTWNRSDEYYKQSYWKGTWEKEGGGVVIDQAIHTLDLMHWFIDSKVCNVDVHMGNRAHDYIKVDDYAEGLINYENGVMASFFAINYYTYDAPVEIEIHCEKGTAKLVGEKATVTYLDGTEQIADRNPLETFDFRNAKSYWGVGHMKEIKHFYKAIIEKTPMKNTVEEVMSTQKLICDIYEVGKSRNPQFVSRK